MKRFSKNDNSAICNYCGKWQPTDLTNQQLEEMDWKCDECKAKEPQPEQEPAPNERGSKEISKYDPEYEFLVKLVKLLVKEGISPQEIKTIADAYPFVTVDDVGDLTAKLWTLATTKYQIPREWLVKHLPKTASLHKVADDFIDPALLQEAIEAAAEQYAGDISTVDGANEFDAVRRELHELVDGVESLDQLEDTQSGVFAEYMKLLAETKPNALDQITQLPQLNKEDKINSLLEQLSIEQDPQKQERIKQHIERIKRASLRVKADMWRGQEEADDMINHAPGYLAYEYGQDKESKAKGLSLDKAITVINKGQNKVISINSKNSTITLVDGSVISFDDAVKMAADLGKTSEFTGAEFSKNDVGVNPTMDIGPFSSPEDQGAKPQKSPFPNTNWLPADDENKDEQPYSNVASSLKQAGIERVNGINVLVNPSQQEIEGLTRKLRGDFIRGLIDPNTGDMFIWDAYYQEHKPMIAALGIDMLYDMDSPNVLYFTPEEIPMMIQRQQQIKQQLQKKVKKPRKQLVPAKLNRPFSKKTAGLDSRYWIAPDGTEFNAGTHHGAWVNQHKYELKVYGIDINQNLNDIYNQMFTSGWSRVSNERGFTIQVADLRRIPAYLDDFIAKHYVQGDTIRIGTDNGMVEIDDPFPSLQKVINKQLGLSQKNAGLTPQAYWVAPNGEWHTVRGKGLPEISHSEWARRNIKLLMEKYPELNIPEDNNRIDLYRTLLQGGWTRIGDSRGASYQIQTADPLHLPSSVIDWIYQNVPNGNSVEIDDANGDLNSYVSITMPVDDIQKEVALGMRRNKMRATLKTADLGGQTVNQIVNALQANGGVTWNLSSGNMVGTNNYAVAIYPDRAQILDGADFDRVEEYIISNSDLLDNPENSFGAWSHDGKVYLDVVATIPDINKAVELGKQHNQIAIWDLKEGKQISTGGTGELKQSSQQPILPQQLQDEVAASTSPVYNIALNNYAEAVKRGHEKDRSLEYAVESVSNLEPIDQKKLVELINKYL